MPTIFPAESPLRHWELGSLRVETQETCVEAVSQLAGLPVPMIRKLAGSESSPMASGVRGRHVERCVHIDFLFVVKGSFGLWLGARASPSAPGWAAGVAWSLGSGVAGPKSRLIRV
jgi:hypothetical protein